MDDKTFLKNAQFNICCMKRLAKDGEPTLIGSYAQFGAIVGTRPLEIYLRDHKTGNVTEEKIVFKSVDEMLAAGWIVD